MGKEMSGVISWMERHEAPRKFLHGVIAPLSIWLYWHGVNLSDVSPVLVSILIPLASLELLRATYPRINSMYISVAGPLMRDSERNNTQVNGVIWYLIGLIVVFNIFPKDIGFLSVLLLSWADLAASTVGRKWGYLTPKLRGKKTLAGSIASFAVGLTSTVLMYGVILPAKPQYNPPSAILYNSNRSRMPLPIYAVIVGLAAAVTELFPIVDDNLSIPILSSSIAWLAVKLTTLPYSYGVLA